MKSILIIYQKNSQYTKILAQSILEGVNIENINGDVYSIEYIVFHVDLLVKYDAVIFGFSTYFGSFSSEMKLFTDTTYPIWCRKLWNNKIAAAYTHSSSISGDKLSALIQMFVFAQQHGMIWVGLDIPCCYQNNSGILLNSIGSWVGLMAQTPSKIWGRESIQRDIETAKYFGSRIAKITKSLTINCIVK